MKLKLGLQRVGSIVFGRVLEQDNDFEPAVGEETCIVLSIESLSTPELSRNALFVRGDYKARDNSWFAYDYECEETAIQAVEDIKALVKMVNSDEENKEPEDCWLEIVE